MGRISGRYGRCKIVRPLSVSRPTWTELVRRADIEFVRCPTFHWIGLTDHKLVRVSLRLVNGPSLASSWKFNTSLLEIWDFTKRLETLIQQALVRVVAGNKWWGSIKYRIRDFAIKYRKQLNLARAKKAKFLDDRLSWAVESWDSLAVDLAMRDLEREATERYKGFVVRSRFKRVHYEADKCSTSARKEEVQRFLHPHIEFVKSRNGHVLRSNRKMRRAFWARFCDRFARCPDVPVQDFRSYLADFILLRELEAVM